MVSAAFMTGLAGCSSSSASPTSTPDSSTVATQVVGPAGATVSAADGTTITIPAGALTAQVTVTIESSLTAPAPQGAAVIGEAHRLGPEGQTFLKPFVLTLPYDPARLPASASAQSVVVYTAPQGSEAYESLPTSVVDATHVQAQGMHFSNFIPAVPGLDAGMAGSDGSSSADAQAEAGAQADAQGGSDGAFDATVPVDASPEGGSTPSDAVGDTPGIDTTCSYAFSASAGSAGGGSIGVSATCGAHTFTLTCNGCPPDAGATGCRCGFDHVILSTPASLPTCPSASNAEMVLEQGCGFSLSGEGGPVLPDAGQVPVKLTTGTSNIGSIAVSPEGIFWTTGNTVPAALMRVGLDGGSAVTLDSVNKIVGGDGMVLVDSSYVYWSYNINPGSVNRMPLSGGPVTPIASGLNGPGGIALDGSGNIYWIDSQGVRKAPLDGGAPTTLATGQINAFRLAVHGADVFWALETYGQIVKANPDGGAPAVVASGQKSPYAVAVDDTSVYWTNLGGDVMKAPLTGGPPTTVGPGSSWTLAVDGTGVYWETPVAVEYAPLPGGNAQTLTSLISGEGPIALDATYLYGSFGGSLVRIAK